MSGMSHWAMLGSARRDRSVVEQKLSRETVRRVVGFALPHRALIAGFLFFVVLDALLVVVNPLLIKALLDDGIIGKDTSLVIWLAVAMAVTSVLDAALGVGSGYLSSRIGESLIFDLRTKVFAHVQRMSLAFFTRTQTGALVSRLNNDVIGAQRAFTSTLSSTVSNSISVVVVGITMFALSWQVTLACLALFPLLLLASRWVGRQISGLTRRQMDGNADLGNMMTERFNVGGALLLKLFGRRDEEDEKYAEKAGVVRDLGIRISLITRIFMAMMMLIPALATALVYGIGGSLAVSGALTIGTLTALATLLLRLLGPLQGLSNVRVDVMTALVSFDRVFEVLDLPSTVAEKPDAVALVPTVRRGSSSTGVAVHLPARRRGLAGVSLETVARVESRDNGQVLHDVTFTAEPGQMVALVGPSGAGKTTITHLVARLYDVLGGAVRVGGQDVRDLTLQSLEDARRLRHAGRAHVPRHHPREPPLRRARRHRRGDLGRRWSRPGSPTLVRAHARRARHRGRRPRLPALRWRAPAAGHRPAAAQGPGDRRARRGDRPPRLRVRVRRAACPRRGPRGAHLAGDRPPALDRAQRRPDPGRRRRPDRAARHAQRAARRGRHSTPTSTAPSSWRTRVSSRDARSGRPARPVR